jgi:hypothetical protein
MGATIQYNLPEDSQVVLEIFNSTGQRILQPANGKQLKGEHRILWNAQGLPAGVYFYTLTAGKQAHSGKIIVLE